jgi:superfamily I DNA and/or RNA helicase
VQRWRILETPEHRQGFKVYANTWLNTFVQILEYCHQATGRKTTNEALGAMSGILLGQYRMHPTIGDLISKAYYRSQLVNKTVEPDGTPTAAVLHPFVSPTGISGKAIVWIDVPWAAENPEGREHTPQYTNPAEVRALAAFLRKLGRAGEGRGIVGSGPLLKLVALSPYTQQVMAINRLYSGSDLRLPEGVEPTDDLRARGREGKAGAAQVAYTVDAFQGNQADIVIVSLVRNNERHAGGGLGFLSSPARINVLLSRAQRLLVLIGSWKFFLHQVSGVNPADPSAPLWHWWQVLTLLDDWFTSGRALKVDAASLETLP